MKNTKNDEIWLKVWEVVKEVVDLDKSKYVRCILANDRSLTKDDIINDITVSAVPEVGHKLSSVLDIDKYIYRVVVNKLIDMYRHSTTKKQMPIRNTCGFTDEDSYGQASSTDLDFEGEYMRRLIDGFFTEDELALFHGELSLQEYANKLGVSYSAAGTRISRRRQEFREVIKER